MVSASDSSLEGYGVSVSFWDPRAVASCGRRLERSWFRKEASTAARKHALTSAGFVKDELTEGWRRREVPDEELLEDSGWRLSDDFVEVPGMYLAKALWEPKLWGKWEFTAGILELEARALVKSLRRIALSVFGSDIRQLLLADNMAVVLSFDRFRSRNYRLLKQIRVFTSYLLARNISATVRWIPSELNNSDEPSRLFAQEESKLLTDLIPTARWPGADVSQKGTNPSTSSREDQETRAEGAPQAAGKEGKHVENDAKFREAQCEGGFGDTSSSLSSSLLFAGCRSVGSSGAEKMRSRRLPSLSSTSNTSEAGGKGAVLKKRAKRRTRKLVNMTMEDGDLTLLEKSAIGERSHKAYKAELDEFKSFARPRGLDVTDASSLDRLLTIYMNKIYLEGYQAYRGDRLAAAVLHFHPQFGKMGSEKLPRMWRALKGFRKLTPGHSRQAYPLMVWAALACELRRVGKLRMALFLLVSLSSYARPSEVIRLQTYCLVRPAHGVTSSWSLLMNPEERGERSKTGEFDNSVA